MKIGFLVNDIAHEFPRYATTLLAREARRRGHQVHYLTVEDFTFRSEDELWVGSRRLTKKSYSKLDEVIADLREGKRGEPIPIGELDVLMLRNDPAQDAEDRPWAQGVGISFGELAVRAGVLVLNDPRGLARALDKLYFQLFPPAVRPTSLITRDPAQIKRFADEHKGRVVLKPLQGSGGESVFLVREDEEANLNQMIEAVRRHGYVVVQEYLPAAVDGDVRMFLVNGEPLKVKGKVAAFRRTRAEGDLRSNMHVGGRSEKAVVTDAMLEVAELVRPRLRADGMFLVGLDLVGDKLLEINVFSPGGLHSAEQHQRAKFAAAILDAIERKLACAASYPSSFTNAQLAAL